MSEAVDLHKYRELVAQIAPNKKLKYALLLAILETLVEIKHELQFKGGPNL